MICPKCGAQTADNSKFCSVCGAPVEDVSPALTGETVAPVKPRGFSNKRNILIIVIALIVLIIGGAATAVALNYRANNNVDHVMTLAERYLSEMKYEQAIIEFQRVIELDPMNAYAYIGLADAYLALDNEESAVDVLAEGYEKTHSTKIVDFAREHDLKVPGLPEEEASTSGTGSSSSTGSSSNTSNSSSTSSSSSSESSSSSTVEEPEPEPIPVVPPEEMVFTEEDIANSRNYLRIQETAYTASVSGDAVVGISKGAEKIVIPDGIVAIEVDAFDSNENDLTYIKLPSSVADIHYTEVHKGNTICFWAESLMAIYVDEDNPYFAAVDGVLYSKDLTQLIRYPINRPGTEFVIPDTVTFIDGDAFYKVKNLTKVHIGKNLKDNVQIIGSIPNLTEITVDKLNPYFDSNQGILYDKGFKTLVSYPKNKSDKEFIVPAGVTTIGISAFSGCNNLESIQIPESVTSIEYGAFSGLEKIRSVVIPDSITSIGDYAFNGCDNLVDVTLPEGLIEIGEGAFSFCGSLEHIAVPDSVTKLGFYSYDGSNPFDYCNKLTNLTYKGKTYSIETINDFYKAADPEGYASCDQYY